MKNYFLFILLFPLSLLAQEHNGDSLKFEMIKVSVDFLVTDKKTFPKSLGRQSTCKYLDYECLKSFCQQNELTGLSKKIDEWRNNNLNTKVQVRQFADKIIVELTLDEKKHRLKLNQYDNYQQKLSELVSKFEIFPPSSIQNDKDLSLQEHQINPDKNILKGEQRSQSDNSFVTELNNGNNILNESESGSQLPTIAFLTSLAALVIGGLAFTRILKSSKNKKLNNDFALIKDEIKELKKRVAQKPTVDMRPVQDALKEMESRIVNLETLPRIIETQPVYQNGNLTISPPDSNQLPVNESTAFARYSDMDNGFTGRALRNSQNGELIYEISITGDSGTFGTSLDYEVQEFALSDYKNYLPEACELINQPYRGCRIVTIEKGTLAKSGDNWIIQSKAKIEFR